MAQRYQVGRVELRAPALPAHDLCLTVARQCGELATIHVGLGHRARQALADPLLLGDVVLPEHGRAPFSHLHPTPNVTLRGTGAAKDSLGEYRATVRDSQHGTVVTISAPCFGSTRSSMTAT